MSFNIGYNDLVRILKAFGHDENSSIIVADYLDEQVDYDMDLSHYLWNTLLFNVMVFDTKEEALDYIEEDLGCEKEDCILYECENDNGVYLEWM